MTRINAGIRVSELTNKMLFAEYREMKRIPNRITSGKFNRSAKIPETFTLNSGHELFFRDKILYLSKRSDLLYKECLKRGIKVTDYSSCYTNIPPEFYNDWIETPESRDLLKERINDRLRTAKGKYYFGDKEVTLQEALIK